MTAAGIVLAAGLSSRMGATKALLDWEGVPLVAYQVAQLRRAGVEQVIVVTGHDAVRVARAVEAFQITIAHNRDYETGRASSVRAGAAAVPPGYDPLVLLNVDQPRRAEVITALLDGHRRLGRITTPAFEGRSGHPIVFSGDLLSELAAVTDADLGLRAVIHRHATERATLDWPDAEVLVDLNDPASYEAARSSWRR